VDELVTADVLIIGGGAAGARAAVEASDVGASIVLVVKGKLGSSGATTYGVVETAGFNVADGDVDPLDNPDVHYQDIVDAGLGMCDERLARILVDEAYARMRDLEKWGVVFEQDNNKYLEIQGCFASHPRMHIIKGHGIPIARALDREIRKRGVRVLENVMIFNSLVEDGRCIGAIGVEKRGRIFVFKTKSVILATGGAGRLFRLNLNPKDITGDGYAIAYRAGAELINMEFMQAGVGTIYPTENLLSSWLWSLKPKLKNKNGKEFLSCYVPSNSVLDKCYQEKSLHFPFSSRDSSKYIEIGIHTELKEGRATERGGILLDFTHVDDKLLKTFPDQSGIKKMWNFTRDWFINRGVNLTREPLQVVVHAHAINGGLRINERAQSTVSGLYAAGEVAGGPHGADRLGGNMLVACQVFGARAGRYAAENAKRTKDKAINKKLIDKHRHLILQTLQIGSSHPASELKKRIQNTMWQNVLVVRSRQSLQKCKHDLQKIREALTGNLEPEKKEIFESLEVGNLLNVAEIMVNAALTREESRGCHYRENYPMLDNTNWNKVISIRSSDGEMKLCFISLPKLGS